MAELVVVSSLQPGVVFDTLPAIIIVFNLNDVASLDHTKYVGLLNYNGGSGKRGFRRGVVFRRGREGEECICDQREGKWI